MQKLQRNRRLAKKQETDDGSKQERLYNLTLGSTDSLEHKKKQKSSPSKPNLQSQNQKKIVKPKTKFSNKPIISSTLYTKHLSRESTIAITNTLPPPDLSLFSETHNSKPVENNGKTKQINLPDPERISKRESTELQQKLPLIPNASLNKTSPINNIPGLSPRVWPTPLETAMTSMSQGPDGQKVIDISSLILPPANPHFPDHVRFSPITQEILAEMKSFERTFMSASELTNVPLQTLYGCYFYEKFAYNNTLSDRAHRALGNQGTDLEPSYPWNLAQQNALPDLFDNKIAQLFSSPEVIKAAKENNLSALAEHVKLNPRANIYLLALDLAQKKNTHACPTECSESDAWKVATLSRCIGDERFKTLLNSVSQKSNSQAQENTSGAVSYAVFHKKADSSGSTFVDNVFSFGMLDEMEKSLPISIEISK